MFKTARRRACLAAWSFAALAGVCMGTPAAAQQPATKIELVSVTGCLRQEGDAWMVINATEAVKSTANAPTKAEMPTSVLPGKSRYHLIGVGEFNLPAHKDQYVVVKGLLIKASPASRVNMTSIVTALAKCGS